MVSNKNDFAKTKKMLHDAMGKLLLDKNQTKESISAMTRFELKNKANADEVMRRVDLRWREDYYKLRKKWSYYIFASLAWTILFQYFLAWFLIFWLLHNIYAFKDVYNLFYLIIWENFAQIIGLSYIIVRFLFSPEKN